MALLRMLRQSFCLGVVLAYLFLFDGCSFVGAEDAVADEQQQSYQEDDDGWKSAYYRNRFKVCDDSVIYVDDISLLCDSPGAYYYGSGKYRNSGTCVPGDKAKVVISFDILDDMENYGVEDPYVYIHVGEYGFEGEVIYEQQQLCALDGLSSTSGAACPEPGEYQIVFQFYLSEDEYVHNSYNEFKPTVTIGFQNDPDDGDYELGGANLDRCDQNSYTNGPLRVTADTIANFFLTFGILILAILSVVIFGYCMYVQMQPEKPSITDTFNVADDDYIGGNYHKYAINWTTSKSLVDILDT